jgi:hypothetical protein
MFPVRVRAGDSLAGEAHTATSRRGKPSLAGLVGKTLHQLSLVGFKISGTEAITHDVPF